MVQQIFTNVLLMSLIGSVLTAALLALKPITKQVFGSHWQYYIWLVVLIVMVLPVRIDLPDETAQIDMDTLDSQYGQDSAEYVVDQEISGVLNTQEVKVAAPRNRASVTIKNVYAGRYDLFTYIWILGTFLFFMTRLIRYGLFIKTLSKNSVMISCPEMTSVLREKKMKNKVCVRVTDFVDAPIISGVFRTSMWLPNNVLSEKEFRYILMHELTHLQRRDLWYKWFALTVSSVHWFNPFIHLVARQINEECEISCDLAVTGSMDKGEKNGYMSTILNFISSNRTREQIFTTAMAKDKDQIIRRFIAINTATKKSKTIIAASSIAAVIILASTLFVSGILNSENMSYEDKLTKDKTNILLIGGDTNQKSADTIMLFSFDNSDKSISILSIPSNTRIGNDNNIRNFIGNMFVMDNEKAVLDALQNNLKIPVDYYVKLNAEGLKNIVDILGGVRFKVQLKWNMKTLTRIYIYHWKRVCRCWMEIKQSSCFDFARENQ